MHIYNDKTEKDQVLHIEYNIDTGNKGALGLNFNCAISEPY